MQKTVLAKCAGSYVCTSIAKPRRKELRCGTVELKKKQHTRGHHVIARIGPGSCDSALISVINPLLIQPPTCVPCVSPVNPCAPPAELPKMQPTLEAACLASARAKRCREAGTALAFAFAFAVTCVGMGCRDSGPGDGLCRHSKLFEQANMRSVSHRRHVPYGVMCHLYLHFFLFASFFLLSSCFTPLHGLGTCFLRCQRTGLCLVEVAHNGRLRVLRAR
jgi:hypothetical protein